MRYLSVHPFLLPSALVSVILLSVTSDRSDLTSDHYFIVQH